MIEVAVISDRRAVLLGRMTSAFTCPPCYGIAWNVNQTCHYESNHCYAC